MKYSKTQESLFTLWTLFILIEQNFESMTGNEDILNSDFEFGKGTFKDLVNSTIQDALNYQILLNTCAFLEAV